MKSFLKTKRCSGQEQVLKNYGDEVWAWLCDEIRCEKFFTIAASAENCPVFKHLTTKTKRLYMAAILTNILLEYESKNNSKSCPIKRLNKTLFKMV